MAPAPRLVLNGGTLSLEELMQELAEESSDPVTALEPDRTSTFYYKSEKILGVLYRNIDETKFVTEMRSQRVAGQVPDALVEESRALMEKLWAYVQRETIYLEWSHHRELAEQIREV